MKALSTHTAIKELQNLGLTPEAVLTTAIGSSCILAKNFAQTNPVFLIQAAKIRVLDSLNFF
jgi:hypothetical protein